MTLCLRLEHHLARATGLDGLPQPTGRKNERVYLGHNHQYPSCGILRRTPQSRGSIHILPQDVVPEYYISDNISRLASLRADTYVVDATSAPRGLVFETEGAIRTRNIPYGYQLQPR